MLRASLLAMLFAGSALAVETAWPQFRGPSGRAVSSDTDLPEKIAPGENQRWVIDLPGRGLSCPVIAENRIFLTANSGMDQSRLHVLAYDETTGKKLWERQFWTTGQTFCHPTTCMACPTIATDGKLVHALFATGDMACITIDGDVKWVRSFCGDYPKMVNHVGRSSSPVIVGDVVAVLMENQGESFLFGIDAATGLTKWKAPRPMKNNWNTPLVIEQDGSQLVLVQSYDGLTAYEPKTGAVKWSFTDDGLSPIPSPGPAMNGDLILAPGHRGLVVFKPKANGVDTVWKSAKLRSATASPLSADGKVYTLGSTVLGCGDLTDGKVLWDLRVQGPFSASPVFADGKLYLASEKGMVTVVQPGKDEGKVLATGDMGEPIFATPAVAHGAIFFRSDKHLWCFSGGKKTS